MLIKNSILAMLVLIAVSGCASSHEVQNIIVIGWDGAQRNHVKEMLCRDELPNLSALSREGCLINIDITNAATDTKAGWAQIFTGYSADITGVYNNRRYRPIPEGYTIFERAEEHFGSVNIDTVAIIGKKDHIGNAPPKKVPHAKWLAGNKKQREAGRRVQRPVAKITEEDGKKIVNIPGQPWYLASAKMDLFVNGLQTNAKVAARALEELENRKDKRLLMFVHFPQPDHVGHKYGENSQEYTDALKDDDSWTGKIIDKLKRLGLYEKTQVYVVADHGFNEGQKGHSDAPYVTLVSNDPTILRSGDRMDIAPTILKRLGIDIAKIEPPLSGVPLDENEEHIVLGGKHISKK